MKPGKPFNITIRWRFAIAAALPLVLMTGLLTTYVVKARHQDLQNQFELTSEVSTQYLGSSAEFPLFVGNRQELRKIANTRLNDSPNLKGVVYLSEERVPLAVSSDFEAPEALLNQRLRPRFRSGDLLYLQRPVYLTEPDIDDYQDDTVTGERRVVGWVIAGFDARVIHQQQRKIVMTGLALGLGGLLLANLLAFLLGRSIVTPIHQLTDTVKCLEAGDLSARARRASTEELARLAQGINLLAKSVAEGRSNLVAEVHKATRQLEQALEDLQVKNSELQHARETAEAANQSKSEFLARMSHELRTPITAIQGFTRLLHNADLGDAERNYCTIIIQSSEQLLNLIDDILAISRLQANAIEIETVPFNLIETLEKSVRQMALPARDKKLELILNIAPEVPSTVVGDPFRVSQIVINLVTNAVKFTNEGYVRTNVSAAPRDDQYTDVTIEISDTGIGIPKQNRNNLFQAFSQADTSITRKYGGTGLGLSIVKNLVDMMGGWIKLDSKEGAGTIFHILLPMPITAVEKDPSNIEARVGLLDKHPLSQQAISNSLCRFVAELVIIEDLAALNETELDTLILSLPSDAETDDNCQYLDSVRKATDVPILALSPSPEASQQHYRDIPRNRLRFLDKPATQQSLHSALCQLISGGPELVKNTAMGQNLLSGLNVLIAEDNPFTREFLKTLLSREGAYCVTARNGTEAVEACNHEPFDIMLIDIHMPEKSGIETVHAIRNSDKANRHVPIITITADVLQQEKLALQDAGITELLFKPVDEELLLKRILHHCRPGVDMPELRQKLGDEIPIEQFLQEVNRLIDCAASACQSGNFEHARDPVHQLLGIAGIFKLPELEVKVASLHRAIKNHRHSQALTALEELQQECERLAETN